MFKKPPFLALPLFGLFFLIMTSSCTRKATTYVYKSKKETLVFPEDNLNIRSTGVCFSGGGTRAMNCAAGQMKALDSLGIWPHVGYISSVSGGTWASSVFTYYRPTSKGPKNDLELLGTPMGAKNLTLEYLKKTIPEQRMIYAVTRDLSGRILKLLLEDDASLGFLEKPQDIWIDAVGETYLKPFGLYGGGKRYFSLNKKSMNDIIQRNPKLKLTSDDFYLVHDQEGDAPRPYLVMNSAILAPADKLRVPLVKPEEMTVFNYSPLGIGAARYLNVTAANEFGKFTFPVGGGFIEPFAMGGTAPTKPISPCGVGHDCADIKLNPHRRFRLADAAGTSSAAFAAQVSESILESLLTKILALGSIVPEEPYWLVPRPNVPVKEYRFADGGSLENFGVISLLQRKVKKIVVFINTETMIDTKFDPATMTPNIGTIDYDFYTLFADFTFENHLNNNVFSREDFIDVYNQFLSCIKNGKTVMAKMNTQTKENNWWGIPDSQSVEILWVYNYKVENWDSLLNTNIQNEISLGTKGMFPNFPWYSTEFPYKKPFLVKLSPAMAKLLYELQFWNVFSNKEAFEFLKE